MSDANRSPTLPCRFEGILEHAWVGSARVAALAGLYLSAGVALYWRVIQHGVFVIDDFDYVVNNPATANLRSFGVDLHELRLVGYLTFAINRAVGGLDPTGFHLVNVLVHVTNALLVAQLVAGVLGEFAERSSDAPDRRTWFVAGAACGLLFLVHPLQTPAVSYVSQRFTSLSTLFYLLTVTTYLALRRRTEAGSPTARTHLLWAASAVSCALAMKTKEISFTIPLAVGLLEALAFRESRYAWRRWAFCAPFVALWVTIPLSLFAVELGLSHPTSAIYENMRVAKQADLFALSPYVYLITQFRVLVRYLRLFLFPVGLRAEYDFSASLTLWDPSVLGSLGLLVGLAGLGVWFWRRSAGMDSDRRPWARLAAFGIAWFFLTASIESSVIPIKHLIFEHRTYLPNVGLLAASTGLLGLALAGRARRIGPTVALALVGVAVAMPLAVGTRVRNRVWTDAVLFWTDVIEKSPRLLAGWHNRAVEYRNAGDVGRALADLDRAVSHIDESFQTRSSWPDPDLNPENVAKVQGVRAKLLLETDQRERAERAFYVVLAMFRISQERNLVLSVLLDIADAFRDRVSIDAAIPFYSRILEAAPGTLDARHRRGQCLAESGRLEEALADLDAVLRADPSAARVYFDRATIQRDLGRVDQARADLDVSCRLGFEPACATLERPGHRLGAEPSARLPRRGAHGL